MSDEDEPGDHCFEDDDEERTLSTDTYLNELDSQQLMERPTEVVLLPPPPSTLVDPVGGTAPKRPDPMILNLAHKFDKLIECPVVELERPVVKKKSPSHTSRIQKQISLYERDKTEGLEERQRPAVRQRSHRSVERMESTSFVVIPEKTTTPLGASSAKPLSLAPGKTKSCVNLKNYYAATTSTSNMPNAARALIVKENFIEPPKRVTKSFHGRTDLLKEAAVAGSSHRFTAAAACKKTNTGGEDLPHEGTKDL